VEPLLIRSTVGDDDNEQTGYRIQLLPLYTGSLAQDPGLASRPDGLPVKDTEPIAVTTYNWPAGHPHLGRSGSGEYFASWYVGQIAEDAVSGFLSLSLSLSLIPFPPSSLRYTRHNIGVHVEDAHSDH